MQEISLALADVQVLNKANCFLALASASYDSEEVNWRGRSKAHVLLLILF